MMIQRAEKLLIYDGGCTYCRAFVSLLGRLDRQGRFSVMDYDSPQAQALLNSQFGEGYGFSMYLFEFNERRVSWGAEAARRVVESLQMPRLLAQLAFRTYPTLVRIVSRLTRHRRSVCGPECAGLSVPRGKQFTSLREEALRLQPHQAS
jgi:predicted DCC family thiol-disulfide oxidoreductase YuxK